MFSIDRQSLCISPDPSSGIEHRTVRPWNSKSHNKSHITTGQKAQAGSKTHGSNLPSKYSTYTLSNAFPQRQKKSSSGWHWWTSFLLACWQLIFRVIEQQKPTRTCSQENSSNETWTVRQRRKHSHTRWDTRPGNAPQPVLQMERRFTRRQTNGNRLTHFSVAAPILNWPIFLFSASQQSSACQCTLSSELPSWSPALYRWVHTDVGERGHHEVILGLPEQLNHDGVWTTNLQHLDVFRCDLAVLVLPVLADHHDRQLWDLACVSLDRDVRPRADIADLPREDQQHTRFGVLVRHCGADSNQTRRENRCARKRRDAVTKVGRMLSTTWRESHENHKNPNLTTSWTDSRRLVLQCVRSLKDIRPTLESPLRHARCHTCLARAMQEITPRWTSKLTLTKVRSKVQ